MRAQWALAWSRRASLSSGNPASWILYREQTQLRARRLRALLAPNDNVVTSWLRSALLLVLAVVTAVACSKVGAAESPQQAAVRIDAASGHVVATVPLASLPYSFAFGAGALWVDEGGVIEKVDARSNSVVSRVSSGKFAEGSIAYAHGALWVPLQEGLLRVAADGSRSRVSLNAPRAIGAGSTGTVWVASRRTLWQLAPTPSGAYRVVAAEVGPFVGSQDTIDTLVVTPRAVWLGLDGPCDSPGEDCAPSSWLVRVDTRTRRATRRVRIPDVGYQQPLVLLSAYGSLWTLSSRLNRFSSLDGRQLGSVKLGSFLSYPAAAAGAGSIWVDSAANYGTIVVWRVSAGTRRVLATLRLRAGANGATGAAAFGASSYWLSAR